MNAPALANANPVRTQPRLFRPGRVVQVTFTPFARLAARGGMLTMFGPTPDEAVRDIVRRLGVDPAVVASRPLAQGDVAILCRIPADASPEFMPGTVQPVAFVEGLGQHEIAESLEWLRPRAAAGNPAQ